MPASNNNQQANPPRPVPSCPPAKNFLLKYEHRQDSYQTTSSNIISTAPTTTSPPETINLKSRLKQHQDEVDCSECILCPAILCLSLCCGRSYNLAKNLKSRMDQLPELDSFRFRSKSCCDFVWILSYILWMTCFIAGCIIAVIIRLYYQKKMPECKDGDEIFSMEPIPLCIFFRASSIWIGASMITLPFLIIAVWKAKMIIDKYRIAVRFSSFGNWLLAIFCFPFLYTKISNDLTWMENTVLIENERRNREMIV